MRTLSEMRSQTLRPSLLALLSTTTQLITPYIAGNPLQPAYQDNFHLPDLGTWDQTQNLPALECFWWLTEKLTEGKTAM